MSEQIEKSLDLSRQHFERQVEKPLKELTERFENPVGQPEIDGAIAATHERLQAEKIAILDTLQDEAFETSKEFADLKQKAIDSQIAANQAKMAVVLHRRETVDPKYPMYEITDYEETPIKATEIRDITITENGDVYYIAINNRGKKELRKNNSVLAANPAKYLVGDNGLVAQINNASVYDRHLDGINCSSDLSIVNTKGSNIWRSRVLTDKTNLLFFYAGKFYFNTDSGLLVICEGIEKIDNLPKTIDGLRNNFVRYPAFSSKYPMAVSNCCTGPAKGTFVAGTSGEVGIYDYSINAYSVLGRDRKGQIIVNSHRGKDQPVQIVAIDSPKTTSDGLFIGEQQVIAELPNHSAIESITFDQNNNPVIVYTVHEDSGANNYIFYLFKDGQHQRLPRYSYTSSPYFDALNRMYSETGSIAGAERILIDSEPLALPDLGNGDKVKLKGNQIKVLNDGTLVYVLRRTDTKGRDHYSICKVKFDYNV